MTDTTHLSKSEGKRERFVRIAEARTSRAMKSIRLIRNLNNTYLYDYAPEDFEMILAALQNEVDELSRAFHKKNSKNTEFRIESSQLSLAV